MQIPIEIAAPIAGILSTVVLALWRKLEADRAKAEAREAALQEKLDQEHEKRLQDLKEHLRDAELFSRALERRRDKSSNPPQS